MRWERVGRSLSLENTTTYPEGLEQNSMDTIWDEMKSFTIKHRCVKIQPERFRVSCQFSFSEYRKDGETEKWQKKARTE